MNKTVKRLISILLVTVMCFSMFAPQAAAWSSLSHVNSADLILLDLERSAKKNDGRAKVTVYAPYDNHSVGNTYSYEIPEEYQRAVEYYPDAFRAGALGPDFYPDMVTGQMYTHPYFLNTTDRSVVESGEWITLLCESVNRLPKYSEERMEALSFTLGYMLHYCGDMFGHDFVNTFTGASYPAYSDVNLLDATDAELNNIVSHMSVENFMDSLVNTDFYSDNDFLGIDAPIQFIADTMVLNGSANGGSASIFEKYGEVPYQYEYLVTLRTEIYNLANEWRESLDPFVALCVMFCDHWVEDLDTATYALVECFNNIAARIVTGKKNPLIEEEKKEEEAEGPSMMDEIMDECFGELVGEAENSTLTIIKEEIGYWLNHYGSYATPIPDIFFDGIPYVDEIMDFILKAIGIGFVFDEIGKLIKLIVKEIIVYAIQEHLPELQEFSVALPGYAEKVKSPQSQLDSKYNPYKPSANNYDEFKVYMDKYAAEQKKLSNTTAKGIVNGLDSGILDNAIDSDFEAFYNTLTMFKLVLMGPENFADFISKVSGVELSGFEQETTNLQATSLKLDITTADLFNAGTDDNIFVEVYRKKGIAAERVIRKLLDISEHNDFEAGITDTYYVELPTPVRVDEIEVVIKQVDTNTAGEDWMCENITITPMHAGIELIEPIGVGGNFYMTSGREWTLDFQTALDERGIADKRKQTVTNVKLDIKTSSNGSTPGTDSDVYLVAYNGSTQVSKVLLDKPNGYNDFEKGKSDSYNISIESYNKSDTVTTGIPLDKLTLKISHEGTDEWVIGDIDVTLYNGNLELIWPKDSGFKDTAVKNKALEITPLKNTNIDEKYFLSYSKPTLSYKTDVNDKLLFFVNSIDGSQQWVDYENVLWNDPVIREKVFFEIFKGFSPEIEISTPDSIAPGEAFDVTVNFKGVWNGIPQARRNAVKDIADMSPVNGKVTVSFINSEGTVVATTQQKTFTDSKAIFKDFSDVRLVAGCYDIKVTYDADSSRPMYADAEQIFDDALVIVPELSFTSQTPAMPAGKIATTYYTSVNSSPSFSFNSSAVPEGFTVEKSGSLVGEGVNKQFSGSPATLKHKFTTAGVYVLTEKLVLKQGTKTVSTKTHTFTIVVSNDACSHSYVTFEDSSSCERSGTKTERCELCGDTRMSKALPTGHKAAEGYEYDDNYHWSRCERCGEIMQDSITTHKSPCTTCGYNYACEPENEMNYICDERYHWIPCVSSHTCPNNEQLYKSEHIPYTRQEGDWSLADIPGGGKVHASVDVGEIVYHCQLGYYCNECGLYYGEKNIHEWTLYHETEDRIFYRCVGYYTDYDTHCRKITQCTATKVIKKAQHEHEWDIDNPKSNTATCTVDGTLTVKCKSCDATKTATSLATGHAYDAAHCDWKKTCKVCGATDGQILGHSYDNACDDICNRCGESRTVGEHTYSNKCDDTCDECGKTRTASKHKYSWTCDPECNECGSLRKAADHTGGTATCTERAKCDGCGEYYGKTVDHDFNEATCTTPMTCKVCGFTAGAQLGHMGGFATCQEKATCTECGQKYGELGVHQVTAVKGTAATCTANGTIDHYKCTLCNALCSDAEGTAVITDTTAKATGHSLKKVDAKAATCTSKGNIAHYKCSKCSKLFSDSAGKKAITDVSVKSNGHKYTNACDTTCNTCSAKRSITHSYNAATCTKAKTCKVCGATSGSKLGHKYSNSCDTTCNTCKATRKITHTYKTTSTTKATLTKNGKVASKCSVCGATKTTTVYYPKTIKLSKTAYIYNGKVQTPTVTVKDSKGNTLKKDTDYTVKYSDGRKNTGKYTVTITFKGKYSGTKKLTYNILPSKTSKISITSATTSLKATWKKVTGATGYKVELLNSKGKVVKSVTTTKLTYTFSKLSKVTTYKVRVTAYKTIDKKAVYSSVSTTVTTSTAPAAATLSKVTAGSKQATVAWKTVSGASGYEVQYSTSKDMKSAKTATVKKGSTAKTTIKSLTKGKTYYFKVRAYKTVDGAKVYGAWSAVKSAKIK